MNNPRIIEVEVWKDGKYFERKTKPIKAVPLEDHEKIVKELKFIDNQNRLHYELSQKRLKRLQDIRRMICELWEDKQLTRKGMLIALKKLEGK